MRVFSPYLMVIHRGDGSSDGGSSSSSNRSSLPVLLVHLPDDAVDAADLVVAGALDVGRGDQDGQEDGLEPASLVAQDLHHLGRSGAPGPHVVRVRLVLSVVQVGIPVETVRVAARLNNVVK